MLGYTVWLNVTDTGAGASGMKTNKQTSSKCNCCFGISPAIIVQPQQVNYLDYFVVRTTIDLFTVRNLRAVQSQSSHLRQSGNRFWSRRASMRHPWWRTKRSWPLFSPTCFFFLSKPNSTIIKLKLVWLHYGYCNPPTHHHQWNSVLLLFNVAVTSNITQTYLIRLK